MIVPASVYGLLPSLEWGIEPTRAQAILDTLAGLDPRAMVDAQAAFSASRGGDDKGYEVQDGIAILGMNGPMTKADSCANWLIGGTSTVALRRSIRAASADPTVKGLLLVTHSPGGEVAGTDDLARDLAAVRKPTATYAEDLMASCAVWVGSQSDEVWANPSAQVGAISVYTVARDVSEAMAREGIKTHVIASSPLKGAGVPGSEITPEQIEEARRVIGSMHDQFVGAVARGRKMSNADASALADARVHVAAEARKLGLVDHIGSKEQAISALRKRAASGGSSATTPTGAASPGFTTKTMNPVQKLVAWAKGMSPEAAQEAGVTAEDIAAAEANASPTPAPVVRETVPDPEIARIKAENETLRANQEASLNARASDLANAFAEGGFSDDKLFRAEVAAFGTLFLNALKADGGGSPRLNADGSVLEGANAKALRDALAARPPVRKGFKEPEIQSEAAASARQSDHDAALASTPLGKQALALREKK